MFVSIKEYFFYPVPNRWPSTIAGMERAIVLENKFLIGVIHNQI